MQIRLASDANRHLVLDRSLLDDARLSFRAKGLLAYLLSHPGMDVANKKLLSSVSLEGMDAIQTALKELEEAGYLRQIHEALEDGSIRTVGVVYPVSRIPVLEAQPLADTQALVGPVPASTKSPAAKEPSNSPAQRIVDQLNALRKSSWDWARYTPISAKYAKNVEHIHGRLADGYAEDDLILVLEYLASVDGGKEESRKYFDCVTPFNTKNFERNLAMARDWDAKGRQTKPSIANPGIRRGSDYYEKARKRSNF
ncbi:helix-turn-helix domain-containing protein [Candidatus Bipolaricaulota bacterium]|nr:helix-turn-helix domain-containing protein [Candidatus Bipolaricaulota bacterium]